MKRCTVAVLAVLAAAGCTTRPGWDQADEACEDRRVPVADFAACLRVRRDLLRAGPPAYRDLGLQYLAAASTAAAYVEAGQLTEAQAQAGMDQIMAYLTSVGEQRRHAAVMGALGAMQGLGTTPQNAAPPPPVTVRVVP
jgi:hypothetical protein